MPNAHAVTPEIENKILDDLAYGVKGRVVAERFNLTERTISDIKTKNLENIEKRQLKYIPKVYENAKYLATQKIVSCIKSITDRKLERASLSVVMSTIEKLSTFVIGNNQTSDSKQVIINFGDIVKDVSRNKQNIAKEQNPQPDKRGTIDAEVIENTMNSEK